MGGKLAMWHALSRPPGSLRSLVVVDISPVDYRDSPDPLLLLPSAVHSEHPLRLAHVMASIDPSSCPSRKDVADRLAALVPNTGLRQFLLTNLAESPSGALRWRLNLPNLIASYQAIKGFPELPPSSGASGAEVRPFLGPTLFVKGERSNYVLDEHLPLIREWFPNFELFSIPDANHWPHFGPTASSFVKTLSEWMLQFEVNS